MSYNTDDLIKNDLLNVPPRRLSFQTFGFCLSKYEKKVFDALASTMVLIKPFKKSIHNMNM